MTAIIIAFAIISFAKVIFALFLPKIKTKKPPTQKDLDDFIAKKNFGSVPLWTLLVPIYNESIQDIKRLRNNIIALKYPNFEVLYLCEEIDIITLFCLKINATNANEKIILIPRIKPYTKPKACNYGLENARGEYIVIYDIEDAPDPYQLHCASYFMQKNSYDCIQFPLNFINDNSLLSGWQVIDYTVWYESMLPGLQMLHAPIPLGGTSNHFRTKSLREVGGWNAYNVTEDAELGLRMKLHNMSVHYVEGYPTTERTIPNVSNLLNQRVRWSKGHIITFIQTFPMFVRKSWKDALCVFFTLVANQFTYIGYIIVTIGLDVTTYSYTEKMLVIGVLIWGMLLFFIYPIILLARFPQLRKKSMIAPTLTYNVYIIFYMLPIIKSLIECVLRPSVWYKTMR